jgi:hypothetical protein
MAFFQAALRVSAPRMRVSGQARLPVSFPLGQAFEPGRFVPAVLRGTLKEWWMSAGVERASLVSLPLALLEPNMWGDFSFNPWVSIKLDSNV